MTYTLTENTAIIRDVDGATIPAETTNIDYQEYRHWLSLGNAPTPYVAPPAPIPSSVALWRAKAALHEAGLLDQADAMITAANNPVLAAFWSNATSIERASPTLASLATQLNLASDQLDALFVRAAAITL